MFEGIMIVVMCNGSHLSELIIILYTVFIFILIVITPIVFAGNSH